MLDVRLIKNLENEFKKNFLYKILIFILLKVLNRKKMIRIYCLKNSR